MLNTADLSMLSSLQEGLVDVRKWMSKNFLQLNSTKTEILVISSNNTKKSSTVHLAECIKPIVRNLGVLFDSILNFEQHITKLVQTCFLSTKEHYQNSTHFK